MKIEINKNDLFYQKIGVGKPIILLHGNEESSAIFSVAVESLRANHTIYLLDQRHHGNSTSNGNLTYEDMRDDLEYFILSLGIKKPIVFGFSDGGIVALMLAIKNPALVDELILAGINISPSGLKLRLRIFYWLKNCFKPSKYLNLMLSGPNLKKEDLKILQLPVKLLYGKKDVIAKRHIRKIGKYLPNAKLSILKDHDHFSYVVDSVKFIQYL
ncbi:MAG: alpha/beta fold hydrolase [Acholeplasmataceae bacterium]